MNKTLKEILEEAAYLIVLWATSTLGWFLVIRVIKIDYDLHNQTLLVFAIILGYFSFSITLLRKP